MTITPAGDTRVARREEVLDADAVRAIDADREPEVHAGDYLAADVAGADPPSSAFPGHVVLMACRVDHEALAEDRAEADERLRNDPVVVVALRPVADRAGRAEPDPAEDRPLERDPLREPPLGDRAEREGRRRDAKDLRREVVEAPEQAPEPAIVVTELVARAQEQAANGGVLDEVRDRIGVRHRGDLELEVVEGSRVFVAGLARKPVDDRVVETALILLGFVGQSAGVDVGRERRAEPQADEDLRVAARKDGVEPIAEYETVEAGRRRDRRGSELAPEAGRLAAALEQQAGHAEQRLADERPADTARDVVVQRRRRFLSDGLPQEAAGDGVPH